MKKTLFYTIFVLMFSLLQCSSGNPIYEDVKKPNEVSNNGTIIKIKLDGEECGFANHADYGVFIPKNSSPLKGILIFQHGCGMEQFGITRPYDLQYQAFAKKWDLAILETALHGDCSIWKDPESGSASALAQVLKLVGNQTNHNELETIPWLLWGHSAGGYWSLAMLRDYPDRILGIVSYSAAFNPKWEYSEVSAKVPLFLRHAGANDGTPEVGCWATALNTFSKLRAMDAPVSIAYNQGQNHNFSYIRYMSIPFFESVLKQRLIDDNNSIMHDINHNYTWLGDTLTLEIYKETDYHDDKKAMCLFPDEASARNWQEFVTTGTVKDKTPPPAPYDVKIEERENFVEISWNAEADIESGILKFNIFKDNILIGRIPNTGNYQTFDTNGDNTYPINVPEMSFLISRSIKENTTISIQAVNNFDLSSSKSRIVYKKAIDEDN